MKNRQGLLTYLYRMGCDYAYGDSPRSRFDERKEFCNISADSPCLLSAQPLMDSAFPLMPPIKTAVGAVPFHPAYQCHTLEELRRAMEAFEGCPLKASAKNTVFSDGNVDASVMLVGEAPGAEEDLQGKPFVGMSGRLLDKMMAAIGLGRSDVYISNIIPWRPPANRPPSTQEIAACLPFIERHIYLKRPKFLLLLGGIATKAILNDHAGIMRLRGKWQTYKPPMAEESYPSIRALPTFHPAFLLRSPGQKVHAWEDLKMLRTAMDEEQTLNV